MTQFIDPDLAIKMPVEEFAGHLIQMLKSGPKRFHPHNICCEVDRVYAQHPQKDEFKEAVMEAFGWMYSEGLIIIAPTDGINGWMQLSRRGKLVNSVSDITKFAQREILPKNFLHPVIAQEAAPIFRTGKYDSAVYEAFKQVEIAVKDASGLPLIGADLMKQAFTSKGTTGPLTDPSADGSEKEGIMFVFAGAIQLFRNATGHNNVLMEPRQAAALIIHASTLMYLVDERKEALKAPMAVP
jgi:uncharacterized protein (TIGR02391 family)